MADEDVEISRGQRAKRLLGEPLLVEALITIEEHFDTKWKNTDLSQVQIREEAFRMLCAIREFKTHLTRMVTTGKLATVAKADRQERDLTERRTAAWDGSPDSGI